MNLPLSTIFCLSGSSLQCTHSSCDTIHLSVMWETKNICLSPVRNYVREILQNTAHSSLYQWLCLIIFIILNLNQCPSSSSSHSHVSNVSHFDLVQQSRKVHQLYKVSHEGKLEILIWQITFCTNDIKYTISHGCQPTL